MKNAIKTLALFSFALLMACKKEDKADLKPKDETWELTAMSSEQGTIYYEDVDTSFYLYEHFSSVGKDFNATVTFGVDGSFKKSGGFKEVVTAVTNGVEQITETSTVPWLQDGQYVVNGNVLTIESDYDKTVAEIISLSSHEMKLKVIVDDHNPVIADEIGSNPAPDPKGFIVVKGTYYYTLSK